LEAILNEINAMLHFYTRRVSARYKNTRIWAWAADIMECESLAWSLALWGSMLLVLIVYVGTHGVGVSPALSVVFFSSLALGVI